MNQTTKDRPRGDIATVDLILAAVGLVVEERDRQIDLWGDQSHHPLSIWATIIGEEYGELCEACLETELEGRHPERGGMERVRKEAIQVAAVAVALIEATIKRSNS